MLTQAEAFRLIVRAFFERRWRRPRTLLDAACGDSFAWETDHPAETRQPSGLKDSLIAWWRND
jgi:hypothetical protein